MEKAGEGDGSGGSSSDSDKNKKGGSPGDKPPENIPPKDPGDGGKKPGDDPGSSGDNVEDLPESAQKLIKDLRSENAKHRNDNKSLRGDFDKLKKGMASALGIGEDDDTKPEDKIADLTGQNDNLNFQNAVLSVAVQNGISEEQVEYFAFLMEKAVNELEEDDELPDKELAAIIQKAKAQKGSGGNSSVDDKGEDGKPKNPDASGDMTLDQFCALNMLQKSSLYREKPDVYNKLVSQAKAQGKLI